MSVAKIFVREQYLSVTDVGPGTLPEAFHELVEFGILASQKDPFDILYWTPGITLIANVDDKSFSLMPEVLYTGITNLEFRLRGGPIVGTRGSEYGEKQNDFRIDFRIRYYF